MQTHAEVASPSTIEMYPSAPGDSQAHVYRDAVASSSTIEVDPGAASDSRLLELVECCERERRNTARILGLLSSLDETGTLLGLGFESTFAYCTRSLGMSESDANTRVAVARLVQRSSWILPFIERGDIHLMALYALRRALDVTTPTEGRHLVEAASRKSIRQVEDLIASHFPQADVPDSIRKRPIRKARFRSNPRLSTSTDADAESLQGEPLSPSISQQSLLPKELHRPIHSAQFAARGTLPLFDRIDAFVGTAESSVASSAASAAVLSAPIREPTQVEPTQMVGTRDLTVTTTTRESPGPTVVTTSARAAHAGVTDTAPCASCVGSRVAGMHATEEAPTDAPAARSPSMSTGGSSRSSALPTERIYVRPLAHRNKPIQPLSEDRYRIHFTASGTVRAKIERAQRLMSHRGVGLAVIFEKGLDLLMTQLEKQRLGKTSQRKPQSPAKPPRKRKHDRIPNSGLGAVRREVFEPDGEQCSQALPKPPRKRKDDRIPNSVRREVFERDGEQCSFVGTGGLRCDGRAFLEIDHRVPRALGGLGTVENARVLCAAHNRYVAEQIFGRAHIKDRIEHRRRHRQSRTRAHPPTTSADPPPQETP